MTDTPNKDELLAQFQSITGADVERTRFYLESSNWQLDLAMSAFFETDNPAEEQEARATMDNMEGEMEAPEAVSAPSAVSATSAAKKPSSSLVPGSGGRIATMANMIRGAEGSDSDEDSDEEQGQAFYAGGSTTSGQQILGPPKKKGADFVSELFKRAREAGAEAVEAGSSGVGGASGGSSVAFSGTAFKLGSDDAASEVVQSHHKPASTSSPPREFTLKMWTSGFSIDDGELRLYNAPENRQFLESVMAGTIPAELVREARGGEVHVNMEDHKTEEFVRPKASRKPFQGQGMMLGGVTPAVASNPGAAVSASSSQDNDISEQTARERFQVDPAQPSTTVQVRLHDGSRLIVKLNNRHTVGDLREYITLARPRLAAHPFTLATTFPNKTLEDEKVSLSDAGLLNAAIMLRLS